VEIRVELFISHIHTKGLLEKNRENRERKEDRRKEKNPSEEKSKLGFKREVEI